MNNEPKKEDLPNGRPLFTMELSKVVPPPNNYDVKRNIDIKKVNPRQACLFGKTYDHYRKTCDVEPGLKVYNKNANYTNTGDYLPEVT